MNSQTPQPEPETLEASSTVGGRRPSSCSPLVIDGSEGYQMSMYGWDPPMTGRYIPKITASREDDEIRIEIIWEREGAHESGCPNNFVVFFERNQQSAAFLRGVAEMMENENGEKPRTESVESTSDL